MRNVFRETKLQQEFERKGYVILPLLSSDQVNLVLSELKLMKPDDNFNPDRPPGHHLTDSDTNIEYKRVAKNFIARVLSPYIEKIFNSYKIIGANFIIKPPGKGGFPVHHDWTFVADPANYTSLTIWCALVDTDENNGTLQVVEGSHNLVSDIATSTVDFYCKNIESIVAEKYSKPLHVKAGECVIFDQGLLHHSDINRTSQPRIVMQAIVIPAEIDPVFYYFDRTAPEKGFEIFQMEPDFFIYQDRSQKPVNLKSLGFRENRNKLLTEEEFLEKMEQKGWSFQFGKWFNDNLMWLQAELKQKGYVVIDFLNEGELQALLEFDRENPLPNDLNAAGISFSTGTSKLSYRQAITEQLKDIFLQKIIKLLPEYRVLLCNLVRKKPSNQYSEMPLHQDPSLTDEAVFKSYGVWCPLIDVDEQNGCLQVVQKSHSLNSQTRPFFVFEGFPYSQEILALMQQHLTSIPMRAGQALIYDKRLFHGSPPNLTPVERVAAICSLVPKEILSHFCYRETLTSSKVELFEVEEEFYDRYIVGQHPEGVKSLGTFDYEVEPLTPEILIEKLGQRQPALAISAWANAQVSFKPAFLEKFNQANQKIAVLVSNEFEGFSRNGGIGTYYTALSQKLIADDWTVVLLLCQTDAEFQGGSTFGAVHHVFSTAETPQILNLQPIHQQILFTTQQNRVVGK
ncbi:MAG TPA: phytanoyl-CoA dioxygenase family protein [Leptolyngbyaceae cyanobacterium M33_DOE_097]|nr:phytanoyl-CoA dioxygenase family protein [Leptolyngbyaceae cyanobacterium M33_DOE_097]